MKEEGGGRWEKGIPLEELLQQSMRKTFGCIQARRQDSVKGEGLNGPNGTVQALWEREAHMQLV